MLLTSDEHLIGRTVADMRFQILSNQISQNHCKIYRKKVATEDAEGQSRVFYCGFLKDTSTNGSYLNWEKLNKNSPESKLHHGDIISFAAPPQHDTFGSETKRQRGIGVGSSEGPISLDDFRSLQRSNTIRLALKPRDKEELVLVHPKVPSLLMIFSLQRSDTELRKQLEDQFATIDQIRNEHRTTLELHEVEKKNLKESITNTYIDELKEMHDMCEAKQKE